MPQDHTVSKITGDHVEFIGGQGRVVFQLENGQTASVSCDIAGTARREPEDSSDAAFQREKSAHEKEDARQKALAAHRVAGVGAEAEAARLAEEARLKALAKQRETQAAAEESRKAETKRKFELEAQRLAAEEEARAKAKTESRPPGTDAAAPVSLPSLAHRLPEGEPAGEDPASKPPLE